MKREPVDVWMKHYYNQHSEPPPPPPEDRLQFFTSFFRLLAKAKREMLEDDGLDLVT